jgi:hypothetical protein
MTPQESAGTAAEAIRQLNHQTLSGEALDVTDVYDILADLSLLAGRLPQLFRQLEQLVDDRVEAGEVVIVDGPNAGDPAAAGAIAGHWLVAASGASGELARRVDAAQQVLTWASPLPSS